MINGISIDAEAAKRAREVEPDASTLALFDNSVSINAELSHWARTVDPDIEPVDD